MILRLQANVKQYDYTKYIVAKRPEPVIPLDQKAGQPLNILLLGSDARVDANGNVDEFGMRADTTMLAHVSADRTRIDIVSIPRDTLVNIPSCMLPSGELTWEQYDAMFNSAFSIGGSTGDINAGATCTLQTVEQLTGITIDGYLVVDFTAFHNIIYYLGGVEMCFTQPLYDADANLSVDAGCHLLDGHQALAFARARGGVGDGSDISRIGRQQELMHKVAEKIFAMNMFSDLPKYYQLLTDITSNIHSSQDLTSFTWLTGFLYSLRNLDTSNINFVTMPHYYEGARVRPNSTAPMVWEALRTDTPIPPEALMPPREDSVTYDPNATTETTTTPTTEGTTSNNG